MKVYQARPNSGLFLGRQGENSARQIRFDVSEWERLYGVGVVQLIVQRHGEDTPYPVALSMDGSEAVWTVSSADTAISGRDGKAELQYYVGDTLAKSCTWDTLVIEALGELSEEPPEAHAGWVEQVLSVASAAVKAQEAAAKSEQNAATSEQNAAASAKTATEKAATVGSAFVAAQGFAGQAKQAATQAEQSAEEAAAAAAEAKEAAKEGASEMAEEAKIIAEQAKAVAEEAAAAAEEAKAAADGAAGAAKEAEEATALAMLAGHAALIAGNGASTHSLGEMYVKIMKGDSIEGELVRISGKTPSMADLENGFSFALSSEDIGSWVDRAPVSGLAVETLEVPPKLLAEGLFDEVVVAVDDNLTMIFDGAAFIVRQDNYTVGPITFPTKGVYVPFVVTSFRVNGFSFDEGGASSWDDLEDKPFEEIGGDTLTWDGNAEGLTGVHLGSGGGTYQWLYLVSDATPSVDDLANGGMLHASGNTVSGPMENDEEFTSADVAGVDGLVVIDSIVFIVGAEAVGVVIEALGGIVFPQEGTYLYHIRTEDGFYYYISSLTIPGYTGFTTEKLKESCLPATVPVVQSAAVGQTIVVKAVDEDGKPTEWEATDPMVLASSTEGSTKKFKITVDDLGTLTATEITEE